MQNIYDWLAYIGGFYKALFGIGFTFSSIFGYNIFVASIMNRLYYFNDDDNNTKSQSSEYEGGKVMPAEDENLVTVRHRE